MSKDQDQGLAPSPWSNSQHREQNGPVHGASTDSDSIRAQWSTANPRSQQYNPYSNAPAAPARHPDRPHAPTRSSTVGSSEPDRSLSTRVMIPHARSEDLNHSSSSSLPAAALSGASPRPSPAFLQAAGGSRPSTPADSSRRNHPSSSGHSDESNKRSSVASFASAHSSSSSSSSASGAKAPPTSSSTSASLVSAYVSMNLQGILRRTPASLFFDLTSFSIEHAQLVERPCRARSSVPWGLSSISIASNAWYFQFSS